LLLAEHLWHIKVPLNPKACSTTLYHIRFRRGMR
jgi:hypothetical protein